MPMSAHILLIKKELKQSESVLTGQNSWLPVACSTFCLWGPHNCRNQILVKTGTAKSMAAVCRSIRLMSISGYMRQEDRSCFALMPARKTSVDWQACMRKLSTSAGTRCHFGGLTDLTDAVRMTFTPACRNRFLPSAISQERVSPSKQMSHIIFLFAVLTI